MSKMILIEASFQFLITWKSAFQAHQMEFLHFKWINYQNWEGELPVLEIFIWIYFIEEVKKLWNQCEKINRREEILLKRATEIDWGNDNGSKLHFNHSLFKGLKNLGRTRQDVTNVIKKEQTAFSFLFSVNTNFSQEKLFQNTVLSLLTPPYRL